MPDQAKCGANQHLNNQGKCVPNQPPPENKPPKCKPNQHLNNQGKCVPNQPPAENLPPKCKPNQQLNPAGTKCVPKQAQNQKQTEQPAAKQCGANQRLNKQGKCVPIQNEQQQQQNQGGDQPPKCKPNERLNKNGKCVPKKQQGFELRFEPELIQRLAA